MTFADIFCEGAVAPTSIKQCFSFMEAKREIRTLFYDRYIQGLAAGLPNEDPVVAPLVFLRDRDGSSYVPRIQWPEIEEPRKDDKGQHWMRYVETVLSTKQAGFMGGKAENIGKRFTTRGLVTVELHLSRSSYETEKCDALKIIICNCFVQANTPGGLWFRNAVIKPVPANVDFFRTNVTAEFEYDSIIY